MPATPRDPAAPRLRHRFRGFLPVVVDVETGGFNPHTDALLEMAATFVTFDAQGNLAPGRSILVQVQPFPGARLDPESMAVNGIRVDSPLRLAVPEREALEKFFRPVRAAVSEGGCNRAVLVGHNAGFDLSFLRAACARVGNEKNPFHPFSVFDTVTLAGVLLGQTALARALSAAGIPYDGQEAHSALYDTERTAELFCRLVNAARPVYERLVTGRGAEADAPGPAAGSAGDAPGTGPAAHPPA